MKSLYCSGPVASTPARKPLFLRGVLLSVALGLAMPLLGQQTGTDDPGWAAPGFSDSTVTATALQADGKLVTAGSVATFNGGDILVQRLGSSGLLDTAFGVGGKVLLSLTNRTLRAADVVVDSRGRITVVSSFIDRDNNFNVTASGVMFVRYLADGELDESFGDDGFATLPVDAQKLSSAGGSLFAFNKMLIQPDGKLLLFSNAELVETSRRVRRAVVMRFDADGTLDTTFADKGSLFYPLAAEGSVTDLVVAGNGAIYFTGNDAAFSDGFVVRLTADGKTDPAFGVLGKLVVPGGTRKFHAEAITLQQDGAIVVGGNGNNAPDTQRPSGILLLRFSANGVLDTSFGASGRSFFDIPPLFSPYSDHVTSLVMEPSGKILAAANRDNQGAAGAPALLRFLQDGQLDAKFADGGGYYPAGYSTEDLEVGDGAFLLVRNQFLTPNGPGAYSIRKVVTQTPTDEPIVDIAGTNRIITDTDGVPGEVVALSGTARDRDGTIVSTRWLVEGLEAGRGNEIQALLSEGISDITFIAIDNDGAQAQDSVRYTVVAPTNPLPKIAGLSSTQRTTNSRFSFAARDASGAMISAAAIGQNLSLMGYIFPQLVDIDHTADIFVVAVTPSGWFMRNTSGQFLRWDSMFATLVPAYENRTLEQTVRVPIYQGGLGLSGSYRMYVGYRRKDRSDVIYNAEAAALEIAP